MLEIVDPATVGRTWRQYACHRRRDGGGKAVDVLIQLRYVPLIEGFARAFLVTLADAGDLVLASVRIGEPIEWLIYAAVGKCVQALGTGPGSFIVDVVKGGQALWTTVLMARHIVESADRTSTHYDEQFSQISTEEINDIMLAALGRIEHAIKERRLIHAPKLPFVLNTLEAWAPQAPGAWVRTLLWVDDDLLTLMRSYKVFTTQRTSGDTFARVLPRFDVKAFAEVLPPGNGLEQIDGRLKAIESSAKSLSKEDHEIIDLFRRATYSLHPSLAIDPQPSP